MSFDIYSKKPKLVEPKLLKYYNDKNKEIEMKEMALKQELDKPIEKEDTITDTIMKCIKEFIIQNYGFVLLFTLIFILLYVRYIEVKNKKKKLKEIQQKDNNNNVIPEQLF